MDDSGLLNLIGDLGCPDLDVGMTIELPIENFTAQINFTATPEPGPPISTQVNLPASPEPGP